MDLGVAASAVAAAGLKLLSALVTKSSCVEWDWNQRAKKVDLFGLWGGLMQDDLWFMKILDDGWSASWLWKLFTHRDFTDIRLSME